MTRKPTSFEVKRSHFHAKCPDEHCPGTLVLEAPCPGRNCVQPYRIDEHHPDFARVREGLERGDGSVLCCYHDLRGAA